MTIVMQDAAVVRMGAGAVLSIRAAIYVSYRTLKELLS